MFCPGGSFIFAENGCWRDKQAVVAAAADPVAFECRPKLACVGPNSSHPCAKEHCQGGYSGFLCATCQPSFTKMLDTGECLPCESPNWGMVVAVAVLVGLVLAWIYRSAGQDPAGAEGKAMSMFRLSFRLRLTHSPPQLPHHDSTQKATAQGKTLKRQQEAAVVASPRQPSPSCSTSPA
jgi:hypothetical protein